MNSLSILNDSFLQALPPLFNFQFLVGSCLDLSPHFCQSFEFSLYTHGRASLSRLFFYFGSIFLFSIWISVCLLFCFYIQVIILSFFYFFYLLCLLFCFLSISLFYHVSTFCLFYYLHVYYSIFLCLLFFIVMSTILFFHLGNFSSLFFSIFLSGSF